MTPSDGDAGRINNRNGSRDIMVIRCQYGKEIPHVNNSTMFDPRLHLNSSRWEKTIIKAKDQVRNSLIKPRLDDYIKESFSSIPTGIYRAIIAALVLVAVAAFWVSSGKQISATAMLLEPVANDSTHLSQFWSDIGVIASLALGELGTILFSVACSLFVEDRAKVLVFRAFSILCAGFAILANVTITMRYNEGATVYGWFVTLAPPLTVIAIGLMIESLLMRSVRARSEAQHSYDVATREYDLYREKPELHDTFARRWHEAIYDEMCYYKAAKEIIQTFVAEDERYRVYLVKWEKEYHDTWALLGDGSDRPFLAEGSSNNSQAPSTDSQPLLTA